MYWTIIDLTTKNPLVFLVPLGQQQYLTVETNVSTSTMMCCQQLKQLSNVGPTITCYLGVNHPFAANDSLTADLLTLE